MSSSGWMNAIEKFDRNVDINSMTRKEVFISILQVFFRHNQSFVFFDFRLSSHWIFFSIVKRNSVLFRMQTISLYLSLTQYFCFYIHKLNNKKI